MKKYLKKPPGPPVRGIVFDLDDTLYLERAYVRSGFARVAGESARLAGTPESAVFDWLWRLFEQGRRGDTFNRLLEAYPAIAGSLRLDDLIEVYRTHTPELKMLPGMGQLIGRLQAGGYRLGLLSDGPLACQKAKVRSLGLDALLGPLVLTDAWGREFWKPHRRGYEFIADSWGLNPDELMYVGDNPTKDFITPKELGWRTVRLRLAGQEKFQLEAASPEYAAEMEIGDPAELTF